jgi:hypothetical protein
MNMSYEKLVEENKKILLNDKGEMEKIEKKIEERQKQTKEY